jgi:hypothetical protein
MIRYVFSHGLSFLLTELVHVLYSLNDQLEGIFVLVAWVAIYNKGTKG